MTGQEFAEMKVNVSITIESGVYVPRIGSDDEIYDVPKELESWVDIKAINGNRINFDVLLNDIIINNDSLVIISSDGDKLFINGKQILANIGVV